MLIFSCTSYTDKEIEEQRTMENSIELISTGTTNLIVNQKISSKQSRVILNKFHEISGQSKSAGEQYAEFILYLSENEFFTKKDIITRLKEYSKQEKNTFISENIDFTKINYKISKDIIYGIKITKIKTKTVPNSFEVRETDYSIPEKVNGYLLSIHYEMTNPYDKEMIVPISNYADITSLDVDKFTKSTIQSRSCNCQIDNGTTITNQNGKELYQITDGKCGQSSNYCMVFKPNETKEFIINFNNPIISSSKKLALISFNQYWSKVGYRHPRDKGIIIDIESKKIIGEIRF